MSVALQDAGTEKWIYDYLARKPFLTEEKRREEKKALNRENTALLFEGLSLLKGTALKIAQLLSMEMDIFPPEITKELQKSYHKVPPINRTLARKTVQNALEKPPESIFETFESTAFAAASLGHETKTRRNLAHLFVVEVLKAKTYKTGLEF
jgi:predicted unusual protein kinase regulating ubiquinone biosynthesis (AarF/ABC1/UbiB family)